MVLQQSQWFTRSPRFVMDMGIYWEAGLFLRTPFTEGYAGANEKAPPPGRQQRCTSSPTTFSSCCHLPAVQFSSVQLQSCHSSSVYPGTGSSEYAVLLAPLRSVQFSSTQTPSYHTVPYHTILAYKLQTSVSLMGWTGSVLPCGLQPTLYCV